MRPGVDLTAHPARWLSLAALVVLGGLAAVRAAWRGLLAVGRAEEPS